MEYKRNLKIGVDNYTDNETVLVTHGNVGIGTTNPKTKLEISGALGFTGDPEYGYINIRIGDNTTGENTIFSNNIIIGSGAGTGHQGLILAVSIDSSTVIGSGQYDVPVTSGSGSDAQLYIFRDVDGVIQTIEPYQPYYGINYQVGDIITLDGADVGGVSGVDDIVVTVTEVGPSRSSFNNFIGNNSGTNHINAQYNNFLGHDTGYNNTIGIYNVFIGESAGYSNTEGSENNFIGYDAGYSNTTGSWNNFIGERSGLYNNGLSNSFFGYCSGANNITGNNNSYYGACSGISTSASYKVIIGSAYGSYTDLFDSPDTTKDKQLAIGIRTDANPANYWLVGNENFNIGIGTTNPISKLTVGGDVNVTGVVTATKFVGELDNQITILTDVSTDGLTFYTGRALVGIATTSPSWTIRRTLSSSAGIVTSIGIARNIAWSNRTSGIYT